MSIGKWIARKIIIHTIAATVLGPLGPIVGEAVDQGIDMIE